MRRWNSRSIWLASVPFAGLVIGIVGLAGHSDHASIRQVSKAPDALISPSVQSSDTQGPPVGESTNSAKLENLRTLVEKISAETRDLTQGGDSEGDGKLVASQLTPEELATLEFWALDPNQDGDARQAALFLLSEAGTPAVGQLAAIAGKPIPEAALQAAEPHSASDYRRSLELSLRVSALEAMDVLAIDEPSLIQQAMGRILAEQSDPTVRFLAQVSYAGTAEGRPGKLQRLVDTLTGEQTK